MSLASPDGQMATVVTSTSLTEPSLNYPVPPPPPGCSIAVYPPAVHFEVSNHTVFSTTLHVLALLQWKFGVMKDAAAWGQGVQSGFAYMMTISVRNVGVEPRRIRLDIPHARCGRKEKTSCRTAAKRLTCAVP